MQRIEEAQRTEQSADELLESHEKIQMTEQIRDSILTQSMFQLFCFVLFCFFLISKLNFFLQFWKNQENIWNTV